MFPEHLRSAGAGRHEGAWWPLNDERDELLFPELMAELDAIKKERIGGLMLRRDWGKHDPWPTKMPDVPGH